MKKDHRKEPRRKRSIIWLLPNDEFISLIQRSFTYDQVLCALGFESVEASGNPYRMVKERISLLELDTSHFCGRGGWSRENLALSPELVLIKDSPYCSSTCKGVFKRFKSVPYLCKKCGHGPEWCGEPLVLIFDHINGDKNDNRPSNLRWLCPMCNSQADTFAGRNVRLKRLARERRE